MISEVLTEIEPRVFGLFELNDEGTILYSRSDSGASSNEALRQLTGRNFFDEAAPFENTDEFRHYVNRFIRSNDPSEIFNFNCRIKNQDIPAKIKLVRIIERSSDERARTTIVDIRRA